MSAVPEGYKYLMVLNFVVRVWAAQDDDELTHP